MNRTHFGGLQFRLYNAREFTQFLCIVFTVIFSNYYNYGKFYIYIRSCWLSPDSIYVSITLSVEKSKSRVRGLISSPLISLGNHFSQLSQIHTLQSEEYQDYLAESQHHEPPSHLCSITVFHPSQSQPFHSIIR